MVAHSTYQVLIVQYEQGGHDGPASSATRLSSKIQSWEVYYLTSVNLADDESCDAVTVYVVWAPRHIKKIERKSKK